MADWVALAVVAQLLRLVQALLETRVQRMSFAILVDVEPLSFAVVVAEAQSNEPATQQWLDIGSRVPHHVAIALVVQTSNLTLAPKQVALE